MRYLRFDANISMLFADLPLLRRPAAAAAAGFQAIEMWWPFAGPVPKPSDVELVVESVADAGLKLVCLNLYAGEPDAGERGLLAHRRDRGRFLDALPVATEVAGRLDCHLLNALYGNVATDAEEDGRAAAVESVALAADAASAIDATIVLEALNSIDFPAYGLHAPGDAVALCEDVRAAAGAQARILLDIYHVARGGGDPVDAIRRYAPWIGHVQLADHPGRRRPGTGSLDFQAIAAGLCDIDFGGWIGLEHLDSADAADTFAWLPEDRRLPCELSNEGGASGHRSGPEVPGAE